VRFRILTRWYIYGPIAVALLAFVIWRANPGEITDLLREASWGPILLAVALNAVVIALWVVRSRALLVSHGHAIGVWQLALIVTFASTASSLTPASAGEAFRAILLQRRHAVPLPTGTAVIVLERVMAIYLLTITTAVAWLWLVLDPGAIGGVLIVVVAFAIGVLPSLLYRRGLRPVGTIGRRLERQRPPRRLAHLGSALVTVDDRIAGSAGDPRTMIVFTLASFGVFLTFAVQFLLVGLAIGVSIDLATAWAVMGASVVVGVLSAIPFGAGAADAAIAVLLPALGVPASEAALMALLYRAVSTIPIALLGVGAYVVLSRTSPQPTTGPATERG
jgi:glycosyltransferase 2 family protein